MVDRRLGEDEALGDIGVAQSVCDECTYWGSEIPATILALQGDGKLVRTMRFIDRDQLEARRAVSFGPARCQTRCKRKSTRGDRE